MKPDTPRKLIPEEEVPEFMADRDEFVVPPIQKGDELLSFENYRPAPEIAPGFYHIPEEALETLWLPELLQRDYEPPQPFVIFDDWGGHYVLLKPEPLHEMVGNSALENYTYQAFQLGGGGFVNIFFNPDASGVDGSQCIWAVAYESLNAAYAAMLRQAIADRERVGEKEMLKTSKASATDDAGSRKVG